MSKRQRTKNDILSENIGLKYKKAHEKWGGQLEPIGNNSFRWYHNGNCFNAIGFGNPYPLKIDDYLKELDEKESSSQLPVKKEKIFDAVPTLQAENLVSAIWERVENKIVPDMLLRCFNQDGLAETCGRILQTDVFFRSETDSFYIKAHSQYFKIDTSDLVFYSIRQIGRKLNDLKYQFNGEGVEALSRSLRVTTKYSGLKSIQALMKTEPSLIRMNDEIDPHGFIMTPDGSRDPFTGKIIIKPGAVYTMQMGVSPEFDKHPKQFFKFLHDIFYEEISGRTEEENKSEAMSIIDRLLDIIAAALTGIASQLEKFLIFSGKGGTGKQQLLELLEIIFGEYFQWMRPESLYETNSGGDTPRSDLLRIQGSLIVGISEPSDAKLSASLFKTLGSGEPIPCRPHHSRNVIEVRPRALFIIAANRKPYLVHDDGTKRRIEVYEFTHEFYNSDERVPDIGKKIALAEGGAILGELMRRAKCWQERGGDLLQITQSETVKNWTDNYIGWSDVIGRFLSDETFSGLGDLAPVKEVFNRFSIWADQNGETRMTGRALGEALHERGIGKVKKETGWKYTGITLKPERLHYIFDKE